MRAGLLLGLAAAGVSLAALWGSPLLVPALVTAGLLVVLCGQGSDPVYLLSAGEGLVVTVALHAPLPAVLVQIMVLGTCAGPAREEARWLAIFAAGAATMGVLVFLFPGPGLLVAIALLGAAVPGLLVYEHRLSRGAGA